MFLWVVCLCCDSKVREPRDLLYPPRISKPLTHRIIAIYRLFGSIDSHHSCHILESSKQELITRLLTEMYSMHTFIDSVDFLEAISHASNINRSKLISYQSRGLRTGSLQVAITMLEFVRSHTLNSLTGSLFEFHNLRYSHLRFTFWLFT